MNNAPANPARAHAIRIAVISDTHGSYPAQLPQLIKTADEIWHLGDVTEPHVLNEIERLGPPLHVVRGNCDEPRWPPSLRREIHGVRCVLVHIPPLLVPHGACDILLHGHTHVPRDEAIDGTRWLNPGSVSQPRGGHPPSFGWLTIENGHPPLWKIVAL